MKFHLPYHFVPVEERSGDGDVPVERLRETPRLGHHRWDEEGLSGRLVCRLTNETPMFIGAERKPGEPATVKPFELDGEPALPATTLRGLLSSVAEAASNSALRVLDDGVLSYRKPMGDSLSAIGMIIEDETAKDEAGKPMLRLRPLVLPHLEAPPSGPAKLPTKYRDMYRGRQAQLKVYLGDKNSIRDPEEFSYRTYRPDRPRFYGLQLCRRRFDDPGFPGDPILPFDEKQHRTSSQNMILAQEPLNREEPRPWEEIPKAERKSYTRGIIRVLGCWGREEHIPNRKYHELFLPYPEEPGEGEEAPTFEILNSAIERFHELADQRTDAWKSEQKKRKGPRTDPLPYEPKDTERNDLADLEDQRFRLKPGDLVYFEPSGDDHRKVGEISLAAIWRDRVEAKEGGQEPRRADAHVFFGKEDLELLPFHPGRKVITLAEQLFGFVASREPEAHEPVVPALAGRLRFSMGRLSHKPENGAYLAPVTLKILNSPKPPAPALYFRPKKGKAEQAIAKTELALGKHRPQGRKFYVHHQVSENDEPWATRPEHPDDDPRANMKSRITPLRKGCVFRFHIDFENLSRDELAMLCYALRPTKAFRHKLGLGKPLGLGTVEIEPLALLYLNRRCRYTGEGFFGPRFHSHGGDELELTEDDAGEAAPLGQLRQLPQAPAGLRFSELVKVFRDSIPATIRGPLEHLGEAQLQNVSNPLVEVQTQPWEKEVESYRWFVANEHGSGNKKKGTDIPPVQQPLEPLDEWLAKHPESTPGSFPTLDIHPWQEE